MCTLAFESPSVTLTKNEKQEEEGGVNQGGFD
jgi:hypothetical protein